MDKELSDIRDRTGIMGNASDPSLDIEPEGENNNGTGDVATAAEIAARLNEKPKTDKKPAEEAESAKDDEESNEDAEADDRSAESETGKEKVEDQSTQNPPAKKKGSSPIKAAFKIISEQGNQIKELTGLVKTIAESLKPKEVEAAKEDLIDKLAIELEAQGENPETIKKIAKAVRESTIQELRDQGLLLTEKPKEALSADDREALDESKIELATRREAQSFNNTEWPMLQAQLKKEYPNATESLLLQARDEMFRIATSEEGGVVIKKAKTDAKGNVLEQGRVKPYPLDYLLHQNRSRFDTILKVVKGPRTTEGGSREIDNGHQNDGGSGESSDDTIEMSLDDQNPETFLKMQKQKIKDFGKESVRIQGTPQ